jgi:uncharacterized protein YecE (DUF72 family)
MAQCFVGTSGFSLQNFYPSHVKSNQRLTYYATIFPSVEVNSTFYHLPRVQTVKNWQAQVSENFVFAFKVYRGVIFMLEGEFDQGFLDAWFKSFVSFETKKTMHVMLFQFPASFKCDLDALDNLLPNLPTTFTYAFEFRHESWFTDEVYQKIIKAKATIVLSDSPIKKNGQPTWPKFDLVAADFSYIRFHGSPEMYASSYSEADLAKYAKLIKRKLADHKNVLAYFNNDIYGYSTKNALSLMKAI